MSQPTSFLRNLTIALLHGPWTPEGVRERARRACRGDHRILAGLSRRLRKRFAGATAPQPRELFEFLRGDPLLTRARRLGRLEVSELYWFPERMAPRGIAAEQWQVPAIETEGQLADWLGYSCNRLDWFADLRGTTRNATGKMRHYVAMWRQRRRGKPRLIEAPKANLKSIQRQILDDILSQIPPHEAAHGFRPGRSILTYAAAHVGKRIVLRFDLRDFFPSISAARVRAVFLTAGYPPRVARLLANLCTTRIGEDVWTTYPGEILDQQTKDRYRRRHLPQGAPTSPALANLCVFRLDRRLAGLVRSADACYTRYADDLAFSGGRELEKSARRFQVAVAIIAAEEGFELHTRKSRFMRAAIRQHLASVVVNQKTNVARVVFDRLKAILHNCRRFGPTTQNRDAVPDFQAHLRGRIAHVALLNPQRGRKLRLIFDQIEWNETAAPRE